MQLRPLLCSGFSLTPDGLRLHYMVGGARGRPNDRLGHIDVAESDDELFVWLFEAVTPGAKLLAGIPQCVDIPVVPEGRSVRDGNAPRQDERRGAPRYLHGSPVPRRPFVGGAECHDWTGARWETRSGPQKWPGGTVHRRLLAPV